MTNRNAYAMVCLSKRGQEVRKGEAMLQIHTSLMKNAYRKFDLQNTIMPTAKRAEWFICVCLTETGSSGCLGPGALERAGGWPDRNAMFIAETAACPKRQAAFYMNSGSRSYAILNECSWKRCKTDANSTKCWTTVRKDVAEKMKIWKEKEHRHSLYKT